jgi:hypothetical protein
MLSTIKTTEKDSMVLVSLSDVYAYNHVFVDLKACNELADSLSSQIKNYVLIANDNEKYLANSDKQILNLNQEIQQRQIIQLLTDKQLKKANRNNKLLKFGLISVSAVAVLEVMYIGIQSIKP